MTKVVNSWRYLVGRWIHRQQNRHARELRSWVQQSKYNWYVTLNHNTKLLPEHSFVAWSDLQHDVGLLRKFLSDNGNTFKSTAEFIKIVFKENTTELSCQSRMWVDFQLGVSTLVGQGILKISEVNKVLFAEDIWPGIIILRWVADSRNRDWSGTQLQTFSYISATDTEEELATASPSR